MDDKFNQWLIDRYGSGQLGYSRNELRAYESEYKIELLDAEISELKNRIDELEGNK